MTREPRVESMGSHGSICLTMDWPHGAEMPDDIQSLKRRVQDMLMFREDLGEHSLWSLAHIRVRLDPTSYELLAPTPGSWIHPAEPRQSEDAALTYLRGAVDKLNVGRRAAKKPALGLPPSVSKIYPGCIIKPPQHRDAYRVSLISGREPWTIEGFEIGLHFSFECPLYYSTPGGNRLE